MNYFIIFQVCGDEGRKNSYQVHNGHIADKQWQKQWRIQGLPEAPLSVIFYTLN